MEKIDSSKDEGDFTPVVRSISNTQIPVENVDSPQRKADELSKGKTKMDTSRSFDHKVQLNGIPETFIQSEEQFLNAEPIPELLIDKPPLPRICL